MTELSPATQAVLAAFWEHPLHADRIASDLIQGALPAALEVIADQVVPDGREPDVPDFPNSDQIAPFYEWLNRRNTRTQFLAIAAEPRGITTTTQENN